MLELTTDKIWNDDVRELFLNGAKTIKTDSIFSETLYRLVQEIDSDLANNKPISHRLNQITGVLASRRYIDENLRKFTDEERKIANDINEKTLSLLQIARLEEREAYEKELKNKETKVEVERIPNDTTEIDKLYKPSENKRGRIY